MGAMARETPVADASILDVVFVANEDYAMPLAAAARSVIDNAPPGRGLRVHIVACDLGSSTRGQLTASWKLGPRQEVLWHDAPVDRVGRLPVWGYFGHSVYYRVLLGEILPAEIGRALYLDSDILVLGSLAPLFDRDLEGQPLGAIRDGAMPLAAEGLLGYEALGLAPDDPYFNSGVLLIELDTWRREDIGDRVLACVDEKRQHIQWPDQDALNATLAGRWVELEARWNACFDFLPPRRPPPSPIAASLYKGIDGLPEIVHFMGTPKPWSPGGRPSAQRLFFDYLDRTAWAGSRPESTIQLRPFPPAIRAPKWRTTSTISATTETDSEPRG